MKAAVWTGYGKIEIKDVPMPVISDNEVLLKVLAAGVCMTDLHVYMGKFKYGEPSHILGHEICAEVVDLGNNVTGIKKRQRVVVETSIGCGHCHYCISGNRHLCKEMTEVGFERNDGGYAEYTKAPAENLIPVPDSLSNEEAAIVESVACPAGMMMRWGVRFAETVAVLGVGPAGLTFIQLAKALGASKVIAVGRNKERLTRSRHFGADEIISSAEEDVQKRILDMTEGEGAGLICEATGNPQMIEESFDFVQKGGRIFFYGLPEEKTRILFPVKKLIMKQIETYGATNAPLVWEPILNLAAAGKINLKDMVTNEFCLDDINKAFDLYRTKRGNPIKAVIVP